ncbi:MAG: orotidine-5'-phosphate decarboxylase [Candidatus Lactobacillus pullistercoris]|uniref:Orotidine 5'-phosphate decarboxylase n=1 Tax=Candidatus Lactobacillus pullistercoris TaxID=2838636 RepID=A0A9E2NTH5_9LACO|nr:orotidine-5'-phosphate decarboxylase [Candidatus Lactobacillus pullistercoris]
MNKPVIVALDVDNRTQLDELLEILGKSQDVNIKIGMELFFNQGEKIVTDLAAKGYKIFLDLKLHDIPNTVYSGMKQLAKLGITYTTVHALGGSQMIHAAKQGLIEGTPSGKSVPKLLAVTELTSISDEVLANEQNCKLPMQEEVTSLAKMAKKAGADGVICSAREVEDLRRNVGTDFLYVTPGIRPAANSHDDQARTATPGQAGKWGSSALVVGRPITLASDPAASYQEIMEEFNQNVQD